MAKKIKSEDGDVFAIPIEGCEKFAIGQVLDNPRPNAIRIAIYDELITSVYDVQLESVCNAQNLVSAVQCTREQLDYNVWKILGNKKTRPLPIANYPNEQFRVNQWIGSKTYDAALVEDFVAAFYGYGYWDDWHDPNYLDGFLIDISKKPKNVKLKKESNG